MKRRVAFICNNLDIGGPQKGLVGLLDRLDPDRFELSVISLQPGGHLRKYLQQRATLLDVDPVARAAQMNRGSMTSDVLTLVRNKAILAAMTYVVGLVAAGLGAQVNPWRQRVWYRARHRLHGPPMEFDAAFAVSSGLSTYFMADAVAAKRKYHWVIGDYSKTAIARTIDLAYFRQLDGGLAVSEEVAEIFTEVFPELSGQRPKPFHHLVPWRFYEESLGEGTPELDGVQPPVVLTVCRLDPGKGLESAIRACRILRDRGLRLTWLVLGDGPKRNALESLMVDVGLEECMKFCGFRPNVSEYLARSEVFVLPSTSEGRSTAVDEAMAMGVVPVITNYRTARSQVTPSVDGFICDFDPESIADAVEAALDPVRRAPIVERLGSRAESDPNPFFLALSE